MKVFVLIMHYETEQLTCSVLFQLQDMPKDVDVFVYDDGSSKKFDLPFVKENFRLIRSPFNIGYVQAVNNAISWIVKDLDRDLYPSSDVAFWTLNTDVTGLSPEMLQVLISKLSQASDIAAVSPAVFASPHAVMYPGPEKEKFVPYIDWVAPLVRLSFWEALNGFDSKLKGFGCDIDICKRGRDKNWRFCILPKQRIHHEMGGTTKTLDDDRGHSDLNYMNNYLSLKYGVHQWTDLKK